VGRDWLAFFLWHHKPQYFPESREDAVREADQLYAANIRDLEACEWGAPAATGHPTRCWPEAYKLYLHYAVFKVRCQPRDLQAIAALCDGFVACLPGARFRRWDDSREDARKALLAVGYGLVRSARELISRYTATRAEVSTALRLEQCVAAMYEAWLSRFPDDKQVQAFLASTAAFIQRLRWGLDRIPAGGF
jgi:hypothetical protein